MTDCLRSKIVNLVQWSSQYQTTPLSERCVRTLLSNAGSTAYGKFREMGVCPVEGNKMAIRYHIPGETRVYASPLSSLLGGHELLSRFRSRITNVTSFINSQDPLRMLIVQRSIHAQDCNYSTSNLGMACFFILSRGRRPYFLHNVWPMFAMTSTFTDQK